MIPRGTHYHPSPPPLFPSRRQAIHGNHGYRAVANSLCQELPGWMDLGWKTGWVAMGPMTSSGSVEHGSKMRWETLATTLMHPQNLKTSACPSHSSSSCANVLSTRREHRTGGISDTRRTPFSNACAGMRPPGSPGKTLLGYHAVAIVRGPA
jgi:hypothetical protein